MSTPRPNPRPFLDGLAIAALVGVLVLPTIDLFVRPSSSRSPEQRERRRATPIPQRPHSLAEMSVWPRRAESAFNDRFGLRDVFLRWGAIVKITAFHRSPRWGVVVGRDGWMSYLDDRLVRVSRGLDPFSEYELEEWRFALESKRDVLAAMGSDYFFGIAPEKDSVYPEHMSSRYPRLAPTRLDQIATHLAQHSDVRFLDYRPALMDEKARGPADDPIYFPFGLHWCGRGLVRGFEETLHMIRPDAPIAPMPRSQYAPWPCDNDSAAVQMGISDVISQSYVRCLTIPNPVAKHTIVEGPKQVRTWVTGDVSLPRVVVVNDSMVDGFAPLLGERCDTLTSFLYKRFDFGEIEPLKPEVVAEIFLERALVEVVPIDRVPQVPESVAAPLFSGSSEALWKLHADFAARPPTFQGGATLDHAPENATDHLDVGLNNSSCHLATPAFDPQATPLVAVVLDVELANPGNLYFDAYGERGLHLHRYSRRVEAGRSTLHFVVPLRASDGVLRMHCEPEPDTVRVHEMEVRVLRSHVHDPRAPR